jgi:hypothetical protein
MATLQGLLSALQLTNTERSRVEGEYLKLLAEEQQLKARLKQLTAARMMAAGAIEYADSLLLRLQNEVNERRRIEEMKQRTADPS